MNLECIVVEADTAALATLQIDRIDRWLTMACRRMKNLPEPLSRSQLKSLIKQGKVSDGTKIIKSPSVRVKSGARYRIFFKPLVTTAHPKAQNIPLNILFEDSELIIIDKPAGMPMHPAPGALDKTLVNSLLYHYGENLSSINGVQRPGIVHRIDKGTSGLVVIAKTNRAHAALATCFAAHDINRAYQAICFGHPIPLNGNINLPIGRHPKNRKRMAVVDQYSGRHAITYYESLKRMNGASLLECQLKTGRTHQIRVHLSHIGHPLIGDPLYCLYHKKKILARESSAGNAARHFSRQALHATVLGFNHPANGKSLTFTSQLPEDLMTLLHALETT
ncbi:pseudouridine synthase, RluA family protein [Candidatus Endolissoclinum faulkneri L2]|uniref:Pseudouridine synthase n=1 Tax=Candidatus Endolissoclinum faulkneri L2 TaxID=1193729 RepID=K7Z568_9PROT|nr:RluA family pseudouridine synthase [Candidatus Endolissoclinum faulkneri]AFX99198.1 pseudouridine synthase, RluA family protein [Candidatus Endolissoclinum faulkneri L2]